MALLLVVIYITFISLGLPDSLFGVSWPLIYVEFGASEGFGSIYSVIVALTSGGVSFFAGRIISRFGTGKITAISVILTAVSLIGISYSPNLPIMLLFSVLGGLGAGAIDTGLNNFVSLNYKAIHMNWLHCFWGVGVSASPIIMSLWLQNGNWRGGYATVACIQFGIAVIVLLSLILWKKYEKHSTTPSKKYGKEEVKKPKTLQILKSNGVVFAIISLGFYCSMEFLLGTWGSSFLINARGFLPDRAALFISVYYGGIMLGRFISGIASLKLSDKILIRSGIAVSLVGVILLFFSTDTTTFISLLLVGLGFGPIFPSLLHAVPQLFGKEQSADITGFMMGGAYAIGFTAQVIFGYTASNFTFNITPYILIAFCFALILFFELTNKSATKVASLF